MFRRKGTRDHGDTILISGWTCWWARSWLCSLELGSGWRRGPLEGAFTGCICCALFSSHSPSAFDGLTEHFSLSCFFARMFLYSIQWILNLHLWNHEPKYIISSCNLCRSDICTQQWNLTNTERIHVVLIFWQYKFFQPCGIWYTPGITATKEA